MTKVEYKYSLDGAKLVKVDSVAGQQMIQCWRGGTTVNVYLPSDERGMLREVDMWSISDEEGFPVGQDTIEEHMAKRFSSYREEHR